MDEETTDLRSISVRRRIVNYYSPRVAQAVASLRIYDPKKTPEKDEMPKLATISIGRKGGRWRGWNDDVNEN